MRFNVVEHKKSHGKKEVVCESKRGIFQTNERNKRMKQQHPVGFNTARAKNEKIFQ